MSNIFILIDGSYFCFYRYHSLLTWWKNAYPEDLDALQNPFQNEKFVEKFKKTFVEGIQFIPKKLGLTSNKNKKSKKNSHIFETDEEPILIIGKDCKRDEIWRNELFSSYKANRANEGFMGGPFFKMAYEENLFIDGGAIGILRHPKLEADDCIAITCKKLLEKYNDSCKIYIITSDKDYLQLASDQVKLFNLAFKDLTEQKSCTGNAECDLFCKILTGDTSDNIPSVFPKCGPKTALKYFEDPLLLENKLKESSEYKKQYELNRHIVDFNYIPEDLIKEFIEQNTLIKFLTE
uniref:5'-3' exonuclease domain-containing protein n=1 Tax=viral metagenome TaxID=1070528 RepID=A0A6C0IW47_9ZZZZ